MKKILFALLLLAGSYPLKAATGSATEIVGEIRPGTSQNATATIAAPGSDKQNCLTSLTVGTYVYGASNAVIRILDGLVQATTVYSLTISTTAGINTTNPVYLVDQVEDPVCASSNNALQIKNSATSYDINYEGFVRKTR